MKKSTSFFILAGAVCTLSSCIKEYDNPAEGVVSDKAPINIVRDAYQGSEITLSESNLAGAALTSGTVISSPTDGNTEPGTFYMQSTIVTPNQIGDLTRGIRVDMGSGTTVPVVLGDSVQINLMGARLGRVNGQLTLSGVSADKITRLATGRTITPRPVTLGMLNYDWDSYEGTLIAVHANVTDFGTGVTLSGDRPLNDGTSTALLSTRSGAAFAGTAAPANAQFIGIAGYQNEGRSDTAGSKHVIRLRRAADVANVSGVMYAGYPESFETPEASAKASYNITATNNDITLATGSWKLTQAILGNTILRDKINLPGKQCARMQQNLSSSGYIQMNYNVTEGASKVTLFYGKYYTDPSSTFRLEVSTNNGTTWTAINPVGSSTPNVSDMPERGSKQVTYLVNYTGAVRFRVNKLGLGTSSATVFNGRLCIEDIVIYKK